MNCLAASVDRSRKKWKLREEEETKKKGAGLDSSFESKLTNGHNHFSHAPLDTTYIWYEKD